jgi:hypothetical protein
MKILEVDGIPVPHEHEPEVKPISTDKKIQILKAAEKIDYCITISRPINGKSINGDEYLLGDNGIALKFNTIKEAIHYLVDNNCEIRDLLNFDFNLEEAI